jgi:hypothetical protein
MIKTFSGDPSQLFISSHSFHIGKVGGACLKDVYDVVNLPGIIRENKLRVLVVSAFKGTTNLLEKSANSFLNWMHEEGWDHFDAFARKHEKIASDLGISITKTLQDFRQELNDVVSTLSDEPEGHEVSLTRDYILSFGERVSREIIQKYLKEKRFKVVHLDPRQSIFVDPKKEKGFGEAKIHLEKTRERMSALFAPEMAGDSLIIMEGFIAAGNSNLGRNGSDTTLALVAQVLMSMSVTPAVTYFKNESLKTKAGLEVPGAFTKYSYFKNQTREGEQPYLHPDALGLYKMCGLPFRIKSAQNPDYQLIVGEEVTPVSSRGDQLSSASAITA